MLSLTGGAVAALLGVVLLQLRASGVGGYERLLSILLVKFRNVQVHRVVWRLLNGVYFVRLNASWRLGIGPTHILCAVTKLIRWDISHVIVVDSAP